MAMQSLLEFCLKNVGEKLFSIECWWLFTILGGQPTSKSNLTQKWRMNMPMRVQQAMVNVEMYA